MDVTSSSVESTTENSGCVNLVTALQENAILKSELEIFKVKYRNLYEENRQLRQTSVNIQAQAEAEEEFISNTLLKRIQSLKEEKETLAMNYEQEEEFLTNDLSKKLAQLKHEKIQLEQNFELEQEQQLSRLVERIHQLEKDTLGKQCILNQLRQEKIDLENILEQEQEMLVNKLWKKLEKVELEKKNLETRIDSTPIYVNILSILHMRVVELSCEVEKLQKLLVATDLQMEALVSTERYLRDENIKLNRKLVREIDRREALTKQLSESETSLEIEDEKHFHERYRLSCTSSPSLSPRRSLSPALHSRTSSISSSISLQFTS